MIKKIYFVFDYFKECVIDICLIARGERRGFVLGDISQVPIPFFTRVNLINITSVKLFSEIVLFVYSIIYYSNAIIWVWKTLQGLLRGIILVIQIHKLIFTPDTLPRGEAYFFVSFETL